MLNNVQTDDGRNELAHFVAQCFKFEDVPLVVMTGDDQETFVPWMASLLRGRVIRSASAYPVTGFLESLDRLDYVFLILEEGYPDDLYLLARDYALDRQAPLVTKVGQHSIHPDHRLAVFLDSSTLASLEHDLATVLKHVCRLNYVSVDEVEHAEQAPRVFPAVEAAIEWCDRYYGNGRFLFRGQTNDWPLAAPLHRIQDPTEHAREAKRTIGFIEWLIGDNTLLDGVTLSEDDALAVAQHHGVKTPLLDVSRNVRVAAFFATHGASRDAGENGAIYVFHESDIRRYMNLDSELGEKFGRGLIEPAIQPLRRIRHQQGLFFESRPWLIGDLVLAKLGFQQPPPGVPIEETFAPPREFIYPPLSPLERVVETYLLVDTAIGVGERDRDDLPLIPDPSFDSSGLAVRAYLDEIESSSPPMPKAYLAIDVHAGILALTCSHLLAHRAHYLWTALEAGRLLRDHALTADTVREISRHLGGAQRHVGTAHPTGIPATPELSIRELVDGLAVYHAIRSGNPETTPAQLLPDHAGLIAAYSCAEHWLGEPAAELFPIAAAFALSCRRPVRAYLDAVVEMGRRGGERLADATAQEGEFILAQWTGHDAIPVADVRRQVPTPVFHQRPLDRLDAWRETHPEEVANLGPFLFRQQDTATARELMPQFTLGNGSEVRVLQHDADLAETIYPLAMEISLFEGLVGLESTMRCPHETCPFHHLRICGRVPSIPAGPDDCRHRKNLEELYKLTPEFLDAIAVR